MKKPIMTQREDMELEDGFFPVALLSSNGKDFAIDIPDAIIPLMNETLIKKATELLRDAFYRIRPDLRKQ